MNRREALKRIGYSFGFLVGTPTAISILQGCSSSAPTPDWKPQYFSDDEAYLVTEMVDIILPATEDTPSASEVGVPSFIDQYLHEVVSVEEQELTKDYLNNITGHLKKESGKNDVSALTKKDIEPMVARSLKKSSEEEEKVLGQLDDYVQSKQQGTQTKLFNGMASYAFITNLRGLAIWSYRTNEQVGEKILAYDPIPGRQQGCVDVQEASNGMAWSL